MTTARRLAEQVPLFGAGPDAEPGPAAARACAVCLLLPAGGVESSSKLRAFLLLRYTLIIATAYLLLVEQDFATPSPLVGLLIALALASNVVVGQLPRRVTDSMRFATAVIVFDTAWVTAALMSSGRFSADFFMLYFFLLLLAAVGENLRLIAIGGLRGVRAPTCSATRPPAACGRCGPRRR